MKKYIVRFDTVRERDGATQLILENLVVAPETVYASSRDAARHAVEQRLRGTKADGNVIKSITTAI